MIASSERMTINLVTRVLFSQSINSSLAQACCSMAPTILMKYAYENLGDRQFEHLIVFLCHELLGIGTQAFADGVDGGRDAKFEGTAQRIPSVSGPWMGITIIQAKHTNGYNRHFSETDFYNPKPSTNSIIAS